MTSGPVAVIDLGSNSIKVLVAKRGPDGRPVDLHHRTIEARISAGIGGNVPQLSEEGMARGLSAVQALLGDADAFHAARITIVATSAVRDAANGAEFRARIRSATGHEVRLLSGNEEASLIGAGLRCDPVLAGTSDFNVFDLGGGSLECLSFRGGNLHRGVSLRLGCVRMMERFCPDPAAPFPPDRAAALAAYVREQLSASGFPMELPAGGVAVGTGGTFSTARSLLGAKSGKDFAAAPPVLGVEEMRSLEFVGRLTLADRRSVSGLPPARADIFPVALVTVLTLAEHGGYPEFRHSVYNLRWGVAAGLLAPGR